MFNPLHRLHFRLYDSRVSYQGVEFVVVILWAGSFLVVVITVDERVEVDGEFFGIGVDIFVVANPSA